jgi:putative hemolysin
MSLIKDSDLRKILKINENEGKWLLSSFKYFFGIERLNKLYHENDSYSGLAFIDSVLNTLNIKYSVPEDLYERIPSSGPFIIISNHPLGGIDGLLLLKLISEIRPDFKIQGNFLLEHVEPLRDYILPVNPFENFKSVRSSYKGIKGAFRHLSEGKALGIFPAGEVSSYDLKDFTITDREWQDSSIRFIRKAGVPVIPIHFDGYNSSLFYLLGQIHPLLRTAKLPSELLRKSKQTIMIQIGKPIKPLTIATFTTTTSLSHYLRAKTYSLTPRVKIEPFFKFNVRNNNPIKENIIEASDIEIIKSELSTLDEKYFLFSHGSFSAYCAPFYSIPNIMQEIGRLREITFREAGEGTNKSIDLDQYDIHYNHLLIWDHVNKKIAGSYRIGKGKDIMKRYGKNGFYSASLFKIKEGFNPVLENSIELGRSFIIKEYQRHPMTLFLLWKGIFRFLRKNPGYQYLIGPVSISNNFSDQSKSLIVDFIAKNFFDSRLAEFIIPAKKFKSSLKDRKNNKIIINDIGNNLKALDLYINEFQEGFSIPILMKKYLKMNGKIIGFNIDSDFNNCLDGLMIVNLSDIPFEIINNLTKSSKVSEVREEFKDLLN